MNKKNIIIIIIISTVVVGLYLLISYIFSFHKINFVVKESGLSISIYKDGDEKLISTFSSDTEISLQNGNYKYTFNNEKTGIINNSFIVDINTSEIIIDPNYSDSYLESVLNEEKNIITDAINSKYQTTINDYKIIKFKLFNKGEWCGVIIRKKVDSRDITDEYRIVLNKVNDSWSIMGNAQIVMTKYNNPEVPLEILALVNDLSGY